MENAEKGKALQLAWRVFCEFDSPDYAPEGTEEFKRCLNDDAYLAGIRYYGAFDEEKLVGMLGIREEKCHICFFFVEGSTIASASGESCSEECGRTSPGGRSRSIPHPTVCLFIRRWDLP
ncbi:MAG: GNAT family N-acetyltransferase [Oscillospiraceae bacterium]|nr:GNAT family N-acetyltransferase [Oscillospiraceae bacterium]